MNARNDAVASCDNNEEVSTAHSEPLKGPWPRKDDIFVILFSVSIQSTVLYTVLSTYSHYTVHGSRCAAERIVTLVTVCACVIVCIRAQQFSLRAWRSHQSEHRLEFETPGDESPSPGWTYSVGSGTCYTAECPDPAARRVVMLMYQQC